MGLYHHDFITRLLNSYKSCNPGLLLLRVRLFLTISKRILLQIGPRFYRGCIMLPVKVPKKNNVFSKR
jgi:hypothetical protein